MLLEDFFHGVIVVNMRQSRKSPTGHPTLSALKAIMSSLRAVVTISKASLMFEGGIDSPWPERNLQPDRQVVLSPSIRAVIREVSCHPTALAELVPYWGLFTGPEAV